MSSVSQSSLNEVSVGKNPNILNEATGLANTETVVSLPEGTTRFRLSIKDHSTSYEVAFTSSGTTYFFSPGETYIDQNVNTTSLNLYIKVAKANKIIQVLYWT